MVRSVLLLLGVAWFAGGTDAQSVGSLAAVAENILQKTLGQGCRDVYPDPMKCVQWKQQGLCNKNPQQMHRLCRFSCGACRSSIGDCVNDALDFVCDRIARSQQCSRKGADACDDSCSKCSNDKEYLISLYMTTWNAANEPPGEVDLVTWAGVAGTQRPDIVVLGMQEMGQPAMWLAMIRKLMKQRGYAEIGVLAMGQITEAVFIKQILSKSVFGIKSTRKGTGLAEVYVNKGGVIIVFNLGSRSLAFVTTHLAAGQAQIPARIKDYNQIFNHRLFGFAPDLNTFDYIFWQGDLNFRIDYQKAAVEQAIKQKKLAPLLQFDQLLKTRAKGMIFQGFEEAPITFAPTYKFDKGTDVYDTSAKQRVPSWTDRILWREKKNSDARVWPFQYFSRPEYTISDHKPVALISFITI